MCLTHAWPYISYVAGQVSKYMHDPNELHWKVSKEILKYVHGTIIYGMHYATCYAFDVIGFTDSVWDGDKIDGNSTYGYVLSLGFFTIYFFNKKK